MEKELRKFKEKKATVPIVAGFAMWILCTINNLGVISGIGANGYVISDETWRRGFDKKTTEKLLFWIAEAMRLTKIPYEVAKQLGWENA